MEKPILYKKGVVYLVTMRHLKTFLAVAETRNMSEAAAKLYVSQPTVSQTISELEKLYKVKLFERYPKELFLTPAGELLRAHAACVADSFDQLSELMQGAALRPALRVGGTLTVGSTVLCPILDELRAALPDIDLSVQVDNTRIMEQKLLQNELDAAIVEGSIRREEIVARPIIRDRLILVCAASHPFAGRTEVEAEELAGESFLLREQGSGTRALFEDFMTGRRLPQNLKWACNSTTAIKQAAIRGYGLAVLSERLVREELERFELCRVNVHDCAWDRAFHLCYHRNKVPTSALRRFIEIAAAYGG